MAYRSFVEIGDFSNRQDTPRLHNTVTESDPISLDTELA